MDVPLKIETSYMQRYRKEWENNPKYKKWLRPVPGNDMKATCVYCKTEFNAKLFEIKRHCETKKHINNLKPYEYGQTTLSVQKALSDPEKKALEMTHRAEILLSLFIAEHTAILPIDHLSELCVSAFPDSKATSEMKLHRTKCSEIIKNVLAPHFKSTLIRDIGKSKYSLIIDESTDITVQKHLGIVIKYFSISMNKIVSTFFALTQLESSDARGIVNAIVQTITDNNLNIKNLVGIGTDNASVMVGINNGVHRILKDEFNLPHLILVRCTCHSLQLAITHASEETMPRNIEFLLRETYNWFSMSPSRREAYATIYATINCGEQPLKILQICATRWLSIEPVVQRILDQWDELKLFFEVTRSKNNCYTAEMLYNMYSDAKNKAYLLYIKSVLVQLQSTLKVFESKSSDPTKLLDSLMKLIESLCNQIVIPSRRQSFDILKSNVADYIDPSPYLGYAFEKFIESFENSEKQQIKKRCLDFTLKLIKELQQRLPENIEILQHINIMSVTQTLKPDKGLEIIKLAEHFDLDADTIDKIVFQWRSIEKNKWENTTDTLKFWAEVSAFKNPANENPYNELVSLAFSMLTLPYSNADVERVFSKMNLIKNKLRNRMNIDTLNSIMYIREGLILFNKCCFNYDIPEEIMKKIGTKNIYKFKLIKSSESAEASTSEIECNLENIEYDTEDAENIDWF